MTSMAAISSRPDAPAKAVAQVSSRVDLWASFVCDGGKGLPHGIELLDEDDKRRCARLHLPSDQNRFLTAHILLRLALSDAVNGAVRPAEWRFERDEHGKLEPAPGFPKLHFSLSHEQRMSVVAVSATNPVGVDVEPLPGCPAMPPVWSAAAPAERIFLSEESAENRVHDFVRLWALKEAYAKMLGLGHALDFCSLEADLAQRQLRQAEIDCKAVFETHMLWCPDDSYFVALAVGTDHPTSIDSRGHLLDLAGASWFTQSEISPQEAVWPKRWKWHWL